MTDVDWRLDNARRLAGFTLHRGRYRRWSETWDHDHCAGCWAKFSALNEPDTLQEGYTTGDDDPKGAGYDWVCETCVTQLAPLLGWSSPDQPATSSAAC